MSQFFSLDALRSLTTPLSIHALQGRVFDGEGRRGTPTICRVDEYGKIQSLEDAAQARDASGKEVLLSDDLMILPGGIDLHVHGRDVWDDTENPIRGTKKDQTHKEDSYTLSLSLAQGGAIFGMCMPNLGNPVITKEEFCRQIEFINSKQSWRPQPILPLGMYAHVDRTSAPFSNVKALYKLMWNTFGPTTLSNDQEIFEVLRPYAEGCWVTAHCETIADSIADPHLPHHHQRQKKAAINAVQLFLQAAQEYGFHAPYRSYLLC